MSRPRQLRPVARPAMRGLFAVARARPRDPVGLPPGRPLLGVSELGARDRAQPQHDAPLRRDARRRSATCSRIRATRKYRLGPRVLDLGFSAINSMELREISAPHLQQLSDETGHTVNMAILDGADIVYVERCRSSRQGQREIDLNLHVGSRLPAYCTSMGKVLLAFLPDEERRPRCSTRIELRARGPNTLTRARRSCCRARARARSRASRSTTRSSPTACARSPRRSARSSGEVAAAINLAVHRSMVSMEDLVARLSPAVKRTAEQSPRASAIARGASAASRRGR